MNSHHLVSDHVHHHRAPHVQALRLYPRSRQPHARVMRTFVVTFVTWGLFLVYMLAFAG